MSRGYVIVIIGCLPGSGTVMAMQLPYRPRDRSQSRHCLSRKQKMGLLRARLCVPTPNPPGRQTDWRSKTRFELSVPGHHAARHSDPRRSRFVLLRAPACPLTRGPRLLTKTVCRQPAAELVWFWEDVGELTMDREKHEQIAARAYALWQA